MPLKGIVPFMRRAAVAMLLCLTAGIRPGLAAADLNHSFQFDIPTERLPSALLLYSEQSGVQVTSPATLVEGRTSPGVVGRLDARTALGRLLMGTSLTYDAVDSRTVVIRRSTSVYRGGATGTFPRAGQGERQEGKMPSSGRFRVAQMAQGAAGSDGLAVEGADRSEAGASALQEVIVTAQKYRQAAFDVPISISVISGAQLRKLKITSLEDLQFYVPGLVVDDAGTTLIMTIRGLSNEQGEQAIVGTYLDEADLTSIDGFGVNPIAHDLARVEVLKGPQGTLYGEGSLGGTIRYITNKPVLDQVEIGTDVMALFDQYGAPEGRIEAVVNAPLIENVLGLRIAAHLDSGGGWVNQPAANLKNINGKNLADVRIEGRWQAGADLTLDATEVIHRATSGRYTAEDPVGVFTQVFNLTTTPQLEDNYNISNLTLNWNPADLTLVNSTTYFTHFNSETEFGTSYQFTPPPSPRIEIYDHFSPSINSGLSDEFRISDAGTGLWRWTLGGLYKRLDYDSPPTLYYYGLPGPPGSPLPTPYSAFFGVKSNSGSVFADTNYRLGRLVLGAGARYFRDNENAGLVGDAQREMGTFTSVDPRFYAQYSVSKNLNVYASAAKGFRSGGFNGDGFPQYQPEHVWTYDLGIKARLLNDHLGIDSDVFLSNYGGYQIAGVPPEPAIPIDITRNAGDARVKGVETDVTWIPTNHWTLTLSGDYLAARITHVNVVDASYVVGDPLDFTPRYQITASAEREFRWLGRAGFARVDYAQRARETFRNRFFGPWYYSQSDYMYLLGFHTEVEWTSNMRLGFFVQNLLNDRGYMGPDVIELNSPRQQPRTFGAEINVKVE